MCIRDSPYVGVMGQAVSERQIEEGIPAGVYVNRAIDDGPAYQAGIQSGDIITEVNNCLLYTSRCV